MVNFPYYSHIFSDSYGNDMGIVREAYHKGVPLLGVTGLTLDSCTNHHLGHFLQVCLKDFLEFLYNERWVNEEKLRSFPAALDAKKSTPSTSCSSGLYVAQLFQLDSDPFDNSIPKV